MFIAMGGPTGPAGPQGPQGDKGDKGDPGAINWTDRGNVGAYDFTVSNFIRDSAWHDLDLSSICPANTKLVLLGIQLLATTAQREGKFKTKGNNNDINIVLATTQAASYIFSGDFWVVPDTNCKIQYWFTSATWTYINVVVRGWFTG